MRLQPTPFNWQSFEHLIRSPKGNFGWCWDVLWRPACTCECSDYKPAERRIALPASSSENKTRLSTS